MKKHGCFEWLASGNPSEWPEANLPGLRRKVFLGSSTSLMMSLVPIADDVVDAKSSAESRTLTLHLKVSPKSWSWLAQATAS